MLTFQSYSHRLFKVKAALFLGFGTQKNHDPDETVTPSLQANHTFKKGAVCVPASRLDRLLHPCGGDWELHTLFPHLCPDWVILGLQYLHLDLLL